MSDREPRFEIEARVKKITRGGSPQMTVTRDLHDVRYVMPPGGDVTFQNVGVERVDFSRLTFHAFNSAGCRFVDCDFSGTKFKVSGGFSLIPRSVFTRCTFDRADLRAMFSLWETRFESCSFAHARLERWRSECAEFVDCTFAGPMRNVVFYGRPRGVCGDGMSRARNEFRGNDFTAAELLDVDFRAGIDVYAQRLPDDPALTVLDRVPDRFRRAFADVSRWPADEDRETAKEILRVLSYGEEAEEMNDRLIRKDSLKRHGHAIVDAVWGLLLAPLV